MIQTQFVLTPNQNPPCYNKLENLMRQMRVRLKQTINAGVDANIFIFIVVLSND